MLNNDLTITNTLNFNSGKITTTNNYKVIANGTVTGGGTGWVIGNLQKPFTATGSKSFEIGGSGNYRQVVVNFTALSASGNLTASVTQSDGNHPQIGSSLLNTSKTVKRYFTLTNAGIAGTYDATFNYIAADVPTIPTDPVTADPNNFIIAKYDGANWTYPTVGTKTSTSTQLTGSTSFSDFAIGESSVTTSVTTNSLSAFGNVCINTTAGPNTFTITGNGLTNDPVTVAALAGFTYSTDNITYTPSLSITQGGGNFSQLVYVKFTPTAIQSYDGNIVVGGGGAADFNTPASGSGVNTPATIAATPTSASIAATTATLGGNITSLGCSATTEWGIYWSTNTGFNVGDGGVTKVSTFSSISTGAFTQNVTGLPSNTPIYFKAFATNAGGTALTNQASFTTFKTEPSAQPTSLVFSSITTTSFSTGFTAASPAADGYLVIRSTSATLSGNPLDGTPYSVGNSLGGGTVASVGATISGIANTSLTAGTTYYTFVFAFNNSGSNIDYLTSTNPLTGSTITLPVAPSPLAINTTQVSFDVSWSAVTGAVTYQLDVATDAGFTSFISGYNNLTATSPTSVTGLSANTQYYFRVRAVNASGAGAYGSGNVTTPGLVAPAANPASLITSTSFQANWGSVLGATGYRLDVSTNNSFGGPLTVASEGFENSFSHVLVKRLDQGRSSPELPLLRETFHLVHHLRQPVLTDTINPAVVLL